MAVSNKAPRILIYRIGSLGDTIIALPVFHQVRDFYPDAHITLLTNKPIVTKAAPIESVLGNGYFFDDVINYPTGTRNIGILLSLWRHIRSLKIDIFINLATTRVLRDFNSTKSAVFRDKLFFKSTGIKKLIGFPAIRQDYEVSLDPSTGELEWEAKRLARRIEELGKIDLSADKYWEMRFTEEEIAEANEATNILDLDGDILAISMGTKRQPNDWEETNWLQLVSRLKKILNGWQLVIIGAPDEFERSEKCLLVWGTPGINLCGPHVAQSIRRRSEESQTFHRS